MTSPRVLVVRQDNGFSETLRQNGFLVEHIELIRTEPVADLGEFDRLLKRLTEYDGVFLTSRASAKVLVDRLRGTDISFAGTVYALGETQRALLENSGLKICFDPEANTAEELIAAISVDEFQDKKLLFIRGNKSMRTIQTMLAGIAEIDEIEVYRTVDNPVDSRVASELRERLERREFDWICFFSPSGVERFTGLFPANGAKVAVIGTTTAKAAEKAGMNVSLISPRATAKDLAFSLIESTTE
jgi:uroporphyrinogen-III synthase